MESNIFITVFFPVALAIVMFGMGLSFVVNDFKRIVIYPKAVTLGLVGQLVLVPIAGFIVASIFPFSTPELAVGLVVVAVCVGGSNSTLLNLLVRGDVPLSITLSAFTNILSVFTIPFIINLYYPISPSRDRAIMLNTRPSTPSSSTNTASIMALVRILPLVLGSREIPEAQTAPW